MPQRPLSDFSGAHRHAGVLVSALSISRLRQWHGQHVFPQRDGQRRRRASRLSQRGRQRQCHAPALLSAVRNTGFQRGRGEAPSYLRACRHSRRSRSRAARGYDLGVSGTELGQHRSVAALYRRATAARGVSVWRVLDLARAATCGRLSTCAAYSKPCSTSIGTCTRRPSPPEYSRTVAARPGFTG